MAPAKVLLLTVSVADVRTTSSGLFLVLEVMILVILELFLLVIVVQLHP